MKFDLGSVYAILVNIYNFIFKLLCYNIAARCSLGPPRTSLGGYSYYSTSLVVVALAIATRYIKGPAVGLIDGSRCVRALL